METTDEKIAQLDGLLSHVCMMNLVSQVGDSRYAGALDEVRTITYALGTQGHDLKAVSRLYGGMQGALTGAAKKWRRHQFLGIRWGKPRRVVIRSSLSLKDDSPDPETRALRLTCRVGFE